MSRAENEPTAPPPSIPLTGEYESPADEPTNGEREPQDGIDSTMGVEKVTDDSRGGGLTEEKAVDGPPGL